MTMNRTWRGMLAFTDAPYARSPAQLALGVNEACERGAWSQLISYAREAATWTLVHPDRADVLRSTDALVASALQRMPSRDSLRESLAMLDLLNVAQCLASAPLAGLPSLPSLSDLAHASLEWAPALRTRVACVCLTYGDLEAFRVIHREGGESDVSAVERSPERIASYLQRAVAESARGVRISWDFYLNRVDGLVRRGYLDPETLLWLARVSMSRSDGVSTIALRFKALVDELLAGESLIERQQAWQVSDPHVHTDDPMPTQTIDSGEYQLDEHVAGVGRWRVYLGHPLRRPHERVLVSWVDGAAKVPPSQLRAELGYTIAGVAPLNFVGTFDDSADPPVDVRDVGVLVEQLPSGESARSRIQMPLAMRDAARLAASVGSILMRAAGAGVLFAALRPELVWVEDKDGLLMVTGVTARSHRFFESRSGGEFNSPVPFPRPYGAPEADRAPTERSLVFTLAAILAEWLSGRHPFPEEWHHVARRLSLGVREPVDPDLELVPTSIRSLLREALDCDPEKRPTLASFVVELERIARSAA
jgi:hypothetical protein